MRGHDVSPCWLGCYAPGLSGVQKIMALYTCTVHGSHKLLKFLCLQLQFRRSGESRNPVSFRWVRSSGCRIKSGMTRELWTLEFMRFGLFFSPRIPTGFRPIAQGCVSYPGTRASFFNPNAVGVDRIFLCTQGSPALGCPTLGWWTMPRWGMSRSPIAPMRLTCPVCIKSLCTDLRSFAFARVLLLARRRIKKPEGSTFASFLARIRAGPGQGLGRFWVGSCSGDDGSLQMPETDMR